MPDRDRVSSPSTRSSRLSVWGLLEDWFDDRVGGRGSWHLLRLRPLLMDSVSAPDRVVAYEVAERLFPRQGTCGMTRHTQNKVPVTDPSAGLVERVTALYCDYAWAVDDHDFSGLRALLTNDVRLTVNTWEIQGVDRFIETYEGLLVGMGGLSRHFITNVRATRSADGTIRTDAYFKAVFHGEASFRIQTGRYRDVHVETPAGLRVAHKWVESDPNLVLPRTVAAQQGGTTP